MQIVNFLLLCLKSNIIYLDNKLKYFQTIY